MLPSVQPLHQQQPLPPSLNANDATMVSWMPTSTRFIPLLPCRRQVSMLRSARRTSRASSRSSLGEPEWLLSGAEQQLAAQQSLGAEWRARSHQWDGQPAGNTEGQRRATKAGTWWEPA